LAADEGLPYVQAALEQLHVLPAEAEQVSSAQGRTEGCLHHAPGEAPPLALCLGGLLLSLAVGGEEAGDLRLREHAHLGRLGLRRFDLIERAAGNEAPAAGDLEHDSEEAEVVADRLRGEARCGLLGDVGVLYRPSARWGRRPARVSCRTHDSGIESSSATSPR
jgi:hypothetical protein